MDSSVVSVEEIKRIEELAIKHFGLEEIQLMENAGRSVAMAARDMIGIQGRTITVLCGKGKNGGDGLVAARFLSNWGAKVNIIIASHPDQLHPLTKDLYGTATAMHTNRMTAVDQLRWQLAMKQSDLLIDGLIGYNIKGDPEGMYVQLINLANHAGKKILSIDCPSGVDCDNGEMKSPCINANATVTFTLLKKGLSAKNAGKLFLADVGIPHEVFELMGKNIPRIFEKKDVVKI